MTGARLAPHERTWGLLRNTGLEEALRFAELSVSSCKACRDAATLAVSELAENLLKYSAHSTDPRAGSIGISVEGSKIRVRSTNNVATPADAQAVARIVSSITPANVAALYRARLEELFKDPIAPRAQLGVLRIAFEGGFALTCSYKPPVLEILATRVCMDKS